MFANASISWTDLGPINKSTDLSKIDNYWPIINILKITQGQDWSKVICFLVDGALIFSLFEFFTLWRMTTFLLEFVMATSTQLDNQHPIQLFHC